MKRIQVKRLLIAAFMLLSMAALVFPGSQPAAAFDFCHSCVRDCWNESGHIYYQCRSNGGTIAQCDAQSEQYYQLCSAMFCPTCPVPANGVPQ